MGSFVALLPHTQTENFAQAVQQGRTSALQNQAQLIGLKQAIQTQGQQNELAPYILQQHQAAAQEAQIRVDQAKQQQADQSAMAGALKEAMGEAPATPASTVAAPVVKDSQPNTSGDSPADADPDIESATAPTPPPPDPAIDPAAPAIAAPSGAAAQVQAAGGPPALPDASVQPSGAASDLAAKGWAGPASPIGGMSGYYAKARKLMVQKGVSPAGLAAFDKDVTAKQEAALQLDAKTREDTAKQYGQIADRTFAFVGQPDAYKSQNWNGYLNGLTRDGLMTDAEHQQTLAQFPSYPGDKVATYLGTSHLAEKEVLEHATNQQKLLNERATQAKTESDTAKNAAELPGITATADEKVRGNQVAQLASATTAADYEKRLNAIPHGDVLKYGYPDPAQFDPATTPAALRGMAMTAEQQTTDSRTGQRIALDAIPKTEAELARVATDPKSTPDQRTAANAALKRLDQSKIAARPITNNTIMANPAATAALKGQLTGEDLLKTLPLGLANEIRSMATGGKTAPSESSRSPEAQAKLALLFQYDPSYTEQRAQIRKSFALDKNIGSLNTAAVHLDQLDQAATALGNGSFRPGNEIYNSLRTTFGSTAPTNFETVKSAVAGEMASALKGNATDVEIANMAKNLQSTNSPQQLHQAIEANMHTLGAKMQTYHERYQQQIPGDTTWSPVLPSARAVFDKHGFDPTAGPAPSRPQGQPQTTAVTLPTSLSTSDVGKTYLNKSGQTIKVTAVNPKNPTQFRFDVVKQ